jgi:hypothetical protein
MRRPRAYSRGRRARAPSSRAGGALGAAAGGSQSIAHRRTVGSRAPPSALAIQCPRVVARDQSRRLRPFSSSERSSGSATSLHQSHQTNSSCRRRPDHAVRQQIRGCAGHLCAGQCGGWCCFCTWCAPPRPDITPSSGQCTSTAATRWPTRSPTSMDSSTGERSVTSQFFYTPICI